MALNFLAAFGGQNPEIVTSKIEVLDVILAQKSGRPPTWSQVTPPYDLEQNPEIRQEGGVTYYHFY